MAITSTALAEAADGLLETALLGGAWGVSLARFAEAAGAVGATLVREEPKDLRRARLHDEFVLATESIAGPVADYLAGRAPPDPRVSRVCPTFGQGFVTDLDQFSLAEIRRSPFYEEFLRPRKLRWHACSVIDVSRDVGDLYLSLKRHVGQDHYEATEIAAINTALPKVQMAAVVSRAVLQAESRGMGRALGRRGEAVVELDRRGRVVGLSATAHPLVGSVLAVVAGRLAAPLAEDDARLDRALAAPLGDPPRVACVILGTNTPGRRIVVRTMPVVGLARDVFGSAAALAVVAVWQKPDAPPAGLVAAMREAFELTGAEGRVAALVGLGVSLAQSARILSIGEGTVRNYFKSAQAKIGVSRQAELAALVAVMQV